MAAAVSSSCWAATAASASGLYPPPPPQISCIINNRNSSANSKLLNFAGHHQYHFLFTSPSSSSSYSSCINISNSCSHLKFQENQPCLVRQLLYNNKYNNNNNNISNSNSGVGIGICSSLVSKSKQQQQQQQQRHSQSQSRKRAALVNLPSNRRRSPAMADPLTNAAGSSPLATTNHLRHVESMATLPSGAGNISRLNAVILGEALASEEDDLVVPNPDFSAQAHVPSPDKYLEMYKRSIEDPAGFWSDIASQFYWKQKWGSPVYSENFDVRKGRINIEWFKGGITNICYNCLDANIAAGNGDKIAIYWEGN